MTTARYFFAGLPNSGKSSFLAAFWIYANNKTGKPALEVTSYPEDADYLDTLQKNWFGFTKVPRTSAGAERTVKLEVKRAGDAQALMLQIPDLSGELFDHIWSERHWTDDFQTIVDEAAGALLFIHPGEIEDGVTLAQLKELVAVLPPENVPEGARTPEPIEPTPYDKNKAPTQIKLIENLQLLAEYSKMRRPFRLGLVISAWDLVVSTDGAATPAGWLNARMPCLLQYLNANRELFDVECFGVSAQGGDYEKPADGFLETKPYNRCVVAGVPVTSSSDVTAPVHWLIKL